MKTSGFFQVWVKTDFMP